LKPSRPGLFELPQLHTASLTFSSEKTPISIKLSSLEILLKSALSNLTCGPKSLSNLALKKSQTLFLTTSLSSHQIPFSKTPLDENHPASKHLAKKIGSRKRNSKDSHLKEN